MPLVITGLWVDKWIQRRVYTVGTFDVLHVRYLTLDHGRSVGDTLAVGVASDEGFNIYKPNVPVVPLEQRAGAVKSTYVLHQDKTDGVGAVQCAKEPARDFDKAKGAMPSRAFVTIQSTTPSGPPVVIARYQRGAFRDAFMFRKGTKYVGTSHYSRCVQHH